VLAATPIRWRGGAATWNERQAYKRQAARQTSIARNGRRSGGGNVRQAAAKQTSPRHQWQTKRSLRLRSAAMPLPRAAAHALRHLLSPRIASRAGARALATGLNDASGTGAAGGHGWLVSTSGGDWCCDERRWDERAGGRATNLKTSVLFCILSAISSVWLVMNVFDGAAGGRRHRLLIIALSRKKMAAYGLRLITCLLKSTALSHASLLCTRCTIYPLLHGIAAPAVCASNARAFLSGTHVTTAAPLTWASWRRLSFAAARLISRGHLKEDGSVA